MEHIFRQWIGMHRAMIAWFHAAHHVTKGTGFGGDHVNLYGEIYTTLDEDLDGIVEKGIGLTGDETLADPVSSLSMAAGLLAQQPASANQDAETIACNAFEVIKYYVKAIEGIYAQFEACGMSLGLDDLLQGLANQYETYVYLLQQRSRTVALNKSPIAITVMENKNMKLTKRQLKRIIREEYSRLKRRGLIKESAGDAEMAEIIIDMYDGNEFEGRPPAADLDEAIDMAFEGQGMPLPDMAKMSRILSMVERQWGPRVTELNISGAIDDYLAFYETY